MSSLALAASLCSPALTAARGPAANARIAGDVIECNGPGRCFTQEFQVSAINAAGILVAQTSTSGAQNRYRLRVPAGAYSLLATSNGGLRCSGSAEAVAHQTVLADITCLVP